MDVLNCFFDDFYSRLFMPEEPFWYDSEIEDLFEAFSEGWDALYDTHYCDIDEEIL